VIHGFRKEAPMNRDQFWLTDKQFSKIEPHLPTDTRGGQGLRFERHSAASCGSGRAGEHPAESQSQMEELLLLYRNPL